ncbi:MAG: hypothetical protein JWN94_3642 [Betaproteobacteria bacterium]|nr:hypothetical protein [Betaproteobacteria bacterium]
MKKITMTACFAATMAAIAFSVPSASAQGDLLDRGKDLLNNPGASGGTAGSMSKIVGALPMDKIKALLEKQGYTKISNLIPTSSGDALQASAVNSSGSPVNLLVNPKTGQVLKALTAK